ncbi:MAG: PEGA domain-containing protein, partial [Myxococcota bacterium]
MTIRAAAFLSALTTIGAPVLVHAQQEAADESTRLAVITRVYGAGSDRAAGFISHYMREIMGNDDRYTLIELSTALGDSTVEAAETQLRNARRLAKQGQDAYETLELDRAMESLNAAIREYDRYAAYISDFRPLAETLLLLAATHLQQGQLARGKERIVQAVVLEPTIEPNPSHYNNSQKATFARVRERMLKARRGSLIIETEPTGAEIYIDGKFIGVSPETVLDVVEGRHYVRLVKDGYRPFGAVVDVKGTVEITDRAVLPTTKAFTDFDRLCDQVFEALNRGKRPREVETLLGQLATLLNTDDLLMQEVRIDGEQVRVLAGQMNLSGKLRSRVRETRFVYDADGDSYARRIAKFAAEEFGPAEAEGKSGSGPG